MRIAIFRKAHFNAAHRLHNPKWSAEKNKEIFGVCNNPNYHGHNYEIEVKVTGDVDPETGYLIDLKHLKDLIKEEIEDRFDHKNLDLDVPEFENMMSTVENLCFISWEILSKKLGEAYDVRVRIWETPRNYAQYPAD